VLRTVVARVEARRAFARGDVVRLVADPARIHVFDTASGARLTA